MTPAQKHNMKRYFVLSGNEYYAEQGMEDFNEYFDSLEEAMAFAETKSKEEDWACVWDAETKETLWKKGGYWDND